MSQKQRVKPRKRVMQIPYGPVYITGGTHKERIGYFDDDTEGEDRIPKAIVYFGDFSLAKGYFLIPFKYLGEVTTHRLMERWRELRDVISPFRDSPVEGHQRAIALEELNYVESVLADRMFTARLTDTSNPSRIFISHSSKDKQFVRWLAVDLAMAGHKVWLDEWRIRVGESIPRKIAEGLDECEFIAVVLSKRAVESNWVENEWHAKYWEEIRENRIKVLPILKEDCNIPTLLKTKKYADFRSDYTDGLKDLILAIDSLSPLKPKKQANKPIKPRR